jgi:hypothetical protein
MNGKAGTLVFSAEDMPYVFDALRMTGSHGMHFIEDNGNPVDDEPTTTDGDGFEGQDMTFEHQPALYRMLEAGMTLAEYAVFLSAKRSLAAIYSGAGDDEAESLIQQLNDRGVRLVLDGPR